MWVGGQRHASAALPPWKTRFPLYRGLNGPHGQSGQVRKISPPQGFDPRTVQLVASRYTDWTILVLPFNYCVFKILFIDVLVEIFFNTKYILLGWIFDIFMKITAILKSNLTCLMFVTVMKKQNLSLHRCTKTREEKVAYYLVEYEWF